jgi:hypothetical protein
MIQALHLCESLLINIHYDIRRFDFHSLNFFMEEVYFFLLYVVKIYLALYQHANANLNHHRIYINYLFKIAVIDSIHLNF